MALFTPETARIMSAKGKAALAAKRAVERQRLNLIDDLLRKAAEASHKPDVDAETNRIVAKRLNRVRLQLDLVDTRIEEEASKEKCDGQLLNWLCSAQERLAEQERQLSGRPLPGTLRPDKPKSKPAQLPPAPDTQ